MTSVILFERTQQHWVRISVNVIAINKAVTCPLNQPNQPLAAAKPSLPHRRSRITFAPHISPPSHSVVVLLLMF